MSSIRLNRLINDAYINNDVASARDAYKDWQLANCYYPQTVNIYDAHQQVKRKITVACGCCYHCIESKINEWCTRMYAHAEDFKNVYFVTLTYRSFTSVELPYNKLVINKLQDAIWHYDNFNITKHFSYNPCLLVKSHYQNFLKRLRKNTGLTDLTFVLCGEYGKTYGRPHFHMILFTNGELTERDIKRAWSVCLWRSNDGVWSYRRNQSKNGRPFDAPIGHVDFHNLVSNGSFNTAIKIKVDNTSLSAARCFAYVCKYVCKRDNVNYSRVSLAYRSCIHKEKRFAVYTNDVQWSQVRKWLQDCGYSFTIENATDNSLKQFIYEKFIFSPDDRVYSQNLSAVKKCSLYGHSYDVEVFPSKYYEFREMYTPFVEFSRGTPIGSLYAGRHVQEFAQGIFNKPILQDTGFVVPSYFRSKASQFQYGLRKYRKSIKGSSFNYSPLLDLLGRFNSASKNPTTLREHYDIIKNRETFDTAIRNDRHVFADVFTGERILLQGNFACHYKFDRHTRDYVLTRSVPLSSWLRYWTIQLQEELQRYQLNFERARSSAVARDAAFCKLTDMGLDYNFLRDRFVADLQNNSVTRENLKSDVTFSVE